MIGNEKFEPLTLWNDNELRYRIIQGLLYLVVLGLLHPSRLLRHEIPQKK